MIYTDSNDSLRYFALQSREVLINGTALTDLSGMRIYFGSSPSSLTQVVQLPGAAAPMNYTVNNLPSGTWYFGATAYTTTGMESSLSAVTSKTIP